MTYFIESFSSPLGVVEVTADAESVLSIHFVATAKSANANQITNDAITQLQEYFQGERQHFDLPLAAQGTEFQKNVWDALLTVDYGETCSYSDIADKINNPKAVRAVGSANGKNPLTIVVPCHRVIGSNGSLTGYASGTERKAWLLNHEMQHRANTGLSSLF